MSKTSPAASGRLFADLRAELAQCRAERDAALAQQTAVTEVLQVVNDAAGNLAPVFDVITGTALKLCEAAFGGLLRFDGTHFHRAALRNLPPALAERNQPLRPAPGMALARLVQGETVVSIADITDDHAYRSKYPSRVAMVELGGARSAVWVALRREDTLLGAFVAYRQEIRPFSDRQIVLLQNFAAQAVVAIENARLLGELRARTAEIAAWNRELEARVAAQFEELQQTRHLKRFLAPQLAELIIARGDTGILKPHRRDIVVVFCDLRGFTTFAETAEPEEVFDLLRQYHAVLGPEVEAAEGTVGHFAGDGIMVFFNDPVSCSDPSGRAVRMAVSMRDAVTELQQQWRIRGHDIGFGVGIAQGHATLGEIGFADRVDYTANGAVCNLAARLCAVAQDGQILISARVANAVGDSVLLEEIGNLALKGLRRMVFVQNVVGLPCNASSLSTTCFLPPPEGRSPSHVRQPFCS
ncbi:MAG TPA: adenylate/guanylate cyclase domain-containing protein [Stellaceae bacterium]|jgi:adenylate cyclase|nr:adenylate/guanylate cyclase domain-containing protein [Stellaceae bacterium]